MNTQRAVIQSVEQPKANKPVLPNPVFAEVIRESLRARAVLLTFLFFSSIAFALGCDNNRSSAQTPFQLADARARLNEPSKINGTFQAEVSTWSETYHVPVRVSSGHVVSMNWPSWGPISVTGGELTGGIANAITSHGEMVRIEIEE